jgi:hypothetical protein
MIVCLCLAYVGVAVDGRCWCPSNTIYVSKCTSIYLERQQYGLCYSHARKNKYGTF